MGRSRRGVGGVRKGEDVSRMVYQLDATTSMPGTRCQNIGLAVASVLARGVTDGRQHAGSFRSKPGKRSKELSSRPTMSSSDEGMTGQDGSPGQFNVVQIAYSRLVDITFGRHSESSAASASHEAGTARQGRRATRQ